MKDEVYLTPTVSPHLGSVFYVILSFNLYPNLFG